jgi:choline-sulfatase
MFRGWALFWIAAAACFAEPTPVILISIDTLRADHLGAYGYRRIRTPNIDSFARGGTLFTSVECQIPLTLPSHTSLFTSTYPFQNQIEENAERVPAGMVTLASVLRSRGYKTAAFIGSVFLERELGLDQGFDVYDSPFRFEAFSPLSGSMFFGGARRNPYSVRDRRDGALVLGAARRWLEANRGQAAFVFVHLFDLHKPYLPRASYDASLEYLDRILGSFKQALVSTRWWQRSLVVLLSDHGESLGDHGEFSHGYFIYESTLWVPLIFHWPDGAHAPAPRNTIPAGLIDVAPTILEFLGIPVPPSFEGTSLLKSAPQAVYSETVYAHDSFGWAPLRSLRAGDYKLIEAPKPELYNLRQDPREANNLIGAEPARSRALRGKLKKLLAAHALQKPSSPGAISPRTRALLASLGYLSGGPRPALAASAADPKDRLAEYRLYDDAQTALYNRRLDEAAAILHRILARDPHNILARRDLGGIFVEQKRYAQARPCLEEVVAAAPDDYVAQFELGLVYKHLGQKQNALDHLRAACRIAPEAEQCRRELHDLDPPASK